MSFIDVTYQFVVVLVGERLGSSSISVFDGVSCCFSYPRVETLVEIEAQHAQQVLPSICQFGCAETFAASSRIQPWAAA
jgi:hypothetical protein